VTSASSPVAQPAPERSVRHSGRASWPQARTAVVQCVVLAVACLITYWLVRTLLSRVYSLSRDDDLLGGMWAVLATIFVLRDSFGKSVAAATSRMAATSVSFVLCLIYLAFLPFHAWALAVLVGASALVVMLLGRPGDAVTAGITTAVIMVVAAISPQHVAAAHSPPGRHRRRRRRRRRGRLDRPTGPEVPVGSICSPCPGQGQRRFTRTNRPLRVLR
jgi:hypothetical protein